MIAVNGFFTTLFLPVAICALFGLVCIRKVRECKYFYELLFLGVLFAFTFLWRLPVVGSRRYMLPVIVPGILLAVLFLQTLCRSRKRTGKYLCGFLIAGCVIAGTGKAMRFQEKKPYLKEMPALVRQDMAKHQWHGALVMLLGNPGGLFDFGESVRLWQHNAHLKFHIPEQQEQFWSGINYFVPESKLQLYPVTYIIITSREPETDFIKKWEEHYHRKPELCYEYIRPKDQLRYQMFRIVSPFPSSRLPEAERMEIFRKFNLLKNPDFSQKKYIPASDKTIRELAERGVQLQQTEKGVCVPEGWGFNPKSWNKGTLPAGLDYTNSGKLHFFSKYHSELMQDSYGLPGGKNYLIAGRLKVTDGTTIFYTTFMPEKYGKNSTGGKVFAEVLYKGSHAFAGEIKLKENDGLWQLRMGLYYGDLELEEMYLVEESVFEEIKK